jgi:hypothetical protein
MNKQSVSRTSQHHQTLNSGVEVGYYYTRKANGLQPGVANTSYGVCEMEKKTKTKKTNVIS